MDANQGGDPNKKTYNKKATGEALKTAEKHADENDLKLFGSCFWYVTISWKNMFHDLQIFPAYPQPLTRILISVYSVLGRLVFPNTC